MDAIVARNLKLLRENSMFTQEQMAAYLGVGRSAYSNYESGSRSVPLEVMECVAKLFGIDLSALFEENEEALKSMLLCAYRAEDLDKDDMKQVAEFKSIAMNYLRMNKLLGL
jgi:transcriptional regulator with XRE-family HTH domain